MRRPRAALLPAALAGALLAPAWAAARPELPKITHVEAADPAAARPELPKITKVEAAAPERGGQTLKVPAGGDLAAALAEARPGDSIVLEAGAVYKGPFVLPKKEGTGWITLRGSAESSLPQSGTRVDPKSASSMPKLVSSDRSVVRTEPGAHHYRLVGLEVRPADGRYLSVLVELGTLDEPAGATAHHLVIDRCWLHGDPAKGARRGVAMNSGHAAVIDSWLSDFKEVGADSQAIAGWNGPGPFKIANNYLEAAGENVMFGGADPKVPDLVPSDIEIRGNHFSKPLSWRIGDPAYAGTPWSVKNLLELKNARRVLVDGNLLENSWGHGQDGFAVLFTVRNQDGKAPWSTIEDVTFTNNVVRHAASGIYLLGRDNSGNPSGRMKRVLIRNNLLLDIDGRKWHGKGTFLQVLQGTSGLVVEHNTSIQSGNILTVEGERHVGFVFRDNLAPHNDYGIAGSDAGVGRPAIARYFPDGVVSGNVMAGGPAGLYPSGNFFPRSLAAAGLPGGDTLEQRLAAASKFRRAGTDGADVGADIGTILDAARAALGGAPPPATAAISRIR